MKAVGPIIERLRESHADLRAAAEAIPADHWKQAPRPGAWSAGEVVAHLSMVEEAIYAGAAKGVQNPPKRTPIWKRLHLPIILSRWRALRAKTPIPLDPALVGERGEMMERYSRLRERTIAFLETHRERDLAEYRRDHPFFGSLNFYSWFRLMAHHEYRHTQQIREIGTIFQK